MHKKISLYICICTRACASVKNTREKFLKKSCENIWSVKNKYLHLHQQNQINNHLKHKIMEKKISRICGAANKCGFIVKHRETPQNVFFAFKSKESDLNLFFEVRAKNVANEKKFRENVSHAVFLLSEDFDPHTETRKYLEKIGVNLTQYTEIYSKMTALAWQIRSFWLSL